MCKRTFCTTCFLLRSKIWHRSPTECSRIRYHQLPIPPNTHKHPARFISCLENDLLVQKPDGKKGWVLWSESLQNNDLRKRVRFAQVKAESRSIEKVVRSYNNDPSRLVDIVRQCIVFRQVSDMIECTRLILQDSELEVCAIKNRMDDDYNSWRSLGYRDCCVNLCIVSDVTRRFRCHRHVAEVQLILLDFAEKKSEDGHFRYVRWRDQLGN
mmetsp:Transcript_4268/g.6727  ORF Transcript_4268/g.6727 Transcript_4268/m.6727 type:complete len:212 (-) Transcript_4268:266-901(-)